MVRQNMRTLVGRILVLFLVYFATAKFGLAINALHHFATLVWPPSGIAVAALLVFGPRLWPGVFLGALAVNFLTGAPWPVACGIAVGNTLEAVVAAFICRYPPGLHISLDRLQDVLRLIYRCALLSTTVSATIGVASLWLGGLVETDQVQVTWLQWWVGDGVGILTFTPLLLTLFSVKWRDLRLDWERLGEVVALSVSLVVVNLLTFTGLFDSSLTINLNIPLIFPVLFWAAVRFGVLGAVISTFLTSAMAIWATAHGLGPFATGSIGNQLIQLDIFVVVTVLIMMVVAALVSDLRKGKEALAEALTSKNLFFSMISHELKTPLTPLKLQLQMIKFEIEEGRTPTVKELSEAMDISVKQIDSLTDLVNDLLDIAKIQTGNFTLAKQEFDFSTLVKEITDRFAPQFAQVNCRVTVHLEENLVGFWDRHRLEQVLVNLFSNVIKYAPGSDVKIETKRRNHSVILSVADSGPGIRPEEQHKVFDRFTRLNHHNRTEGMGLGLFIVKKMTDAHGGKVRLESESGKGAKFIVELPEGQ